MQIAYRFAPLRGLARDAVITTYPQGFVNRFTDMVVDNGYPASRRGDAYFLPNTSLPWTNIPRVIYAIASSNLRAGIVFIERDNVWYYDGVDFSNISPTGGLAVNSWTWEADYVGAGVIMASPENVPLLWAQSDHPYNPAVRYDDQAVWGWPTERTAVCIRSYQSYLVALLAKDLHNAASVDANFRIRWSNPGDIVTIPVWEDDLTVKPDTVAGYVDQETRFGALVDQRVFGADNLLFYQSGILRMTYAGSVDPINVFTFDTFREDDGCINTGATCVTPDGIFVVGQDSIYITNGSVKRDIDQDEEIGGTTVRDLIYGTLGEPVSVKCHYNPRWKEVYLLCGSDGNVGTKKTRGYIYNLHRKAWSELRIGDADGNDAIQDVYGIGGGFNFTAERQKIDRTEGLYTLMTTYTNDQPELLTFNQYQTSDGADNNPLRAIVRTDWMSLHEMAEQPRHKRIRLRKVFPLVECSTTVRVWVGRKQFGINSAEEWTDYGEFDCVNDESISVDLAVGAYFAIQIGRGTDDTEVARFKVIGFDLDYELGEEGW